MINDNLRAIGCEEDGSDVFLDMNLPVQAWKTDAGEIYFHYYMPRKGYEWVGERDTEPNPLVTARNAARLLRNLADLFDAFAKGEIDHVYYPDELVRDAIERMKNKDDK